MQSVLITPLVKQYAYEDWCKNLGYPIQPILVTPPSPLPYLIKRSLSAPSAIHIPRAQIMKKICPKKQESVSTTIETLELAIFKKVLPKPIDIEVCNTLVNMQQIASL